MLSVIMLSAVILIVVMLNVLTLSDIIVVCCGACHCHSFSPRIIFAGMAKTLPVGVVP